MLHCVKCQKAITAPAEKCPDCGTPLLTDQRGDELLEKVLPLLAQERKLESVKIVREMLGSSLLEAMNVVEMFAAEPLPAPTSETSDGSWEAEARELLLQGRKIAAVKVCKDRTSCDLMTAKKRVEDFAAAQGLNAQRGCLGSVLLIVALLAGLVVLGISHGG